MKKIRKVNDPISNLAVKLIDWEVASKEDLKAIENNAKADEDREVAEVEQMPEPEAALTILFEDVYIRGSKMAFVRGRTTDEDYFY